MGDFIRNKIRAANTERETKKKAGQNARARPGGESDNSELEKKLSELIRQDDLDGVVAVWREGMKANKFAWSQGKQCFVDTGFPDWDIRERMAAKVAAYKDGLPVAKQMVLSGSFEDFGKMIEKLRGSPEALRALQSMTGELPAIEVQSDESLQKTPESSESDRPDTSYTGENQSSAEK